MTRDYHSDLAAELFKVPRAAVVPSQRTAAKLLLFKFAYGRVPTWIERALIPTTYLIQQELLANLGGE